jgi:hypothetical protein
VGQLSTVTLDKEKKLPELQFAIRTLWVAARIVAVLYLGQSGTLFFYQGF